MKLYNLFLSAFIVSAAMMPLAAPSAHAQSLPDFLGVIGSGVIGNGRIGPGDAVNMLGGALREIDRNQKQAEAKRLQAEAARKEQARRAELKKTSAGRKQLAREDAAVKRRAQKQQRQQQQFMNSLSNASAGRSRNNNSNRIEEGVEFLRQQQRQDMEDLHTFNQRYNTPVQ